MFCPSCGFEYTQKTNYCKRCGGVLSSPDQAPVIQPPGPTITGMFLVIAALALFGLMLVYNIYMKLLYAGVRGRELFIPVLLGFALIGAISLLLTWSLSRVITAARKQAKQEVPTFIEVQPQIAGSKDPISNAIERPSVVEHTTRQMADVYREPQTRE